MARHTVSNGTGETWYVEELWEMAKGLPVKVIPLSRVLNELDAVSWFLTDGEPPTCLAVARHAERIFYAKMQYPIILARDGTVMDGLHRIAKAHIFGYEQILAVQFEEDPQPAERAGESNRECPTS